MRGVEVAPATSSPRRSPTRRPSATGCTGRTCAGTYVTGTGKDGQPRQIYLYHVVDNERVDAPSTAHQAVVWQTALNPVVALELLAEGVWSGEGVLGPEAFDAVPFLELLAEYGSPHGIDDRAAL